jgi:hypothetical protein
MALLRFLTGFVAFCACLVDQRVLAQFAQDIDIGLAHLPSGGSQTVYS